MLRRIIDFIRKKLGFESDDEPPTDPPSFYIGPTNTQSLNRVAELRHDLEAEGYQLDGWVLYCPPGFYEDLYDALDFVQDGTPKARGLPVMIDNAVESPRILPRSVSDIPVDMAHQVNPPTELTRQLIEAVGIESVEASKPHLGLEITSYRTWLFYRVTRRRQEVDRDIIDKYDLEPLTPGGFREYDRETDDTARVKFGFENRMSDRELEAGLTDGQNPVRKFVDVAQRHTDSVSEQPVIGLRRRKFTFPCRALDFEHRERHRCGTSYTHYGGLFMLPFDVDESVSRIELAEGDAHRKF